LRTSTSGTKIVKPTITLNELADRITPPRRRGDIAKMRERIRHWTNANLLFPVNVNPGKGSARMYGREAIVEAAILAAIEETPGLSVLALKREWLFTLAVAKDAAHQWLYDKRPRWLVLEWFRLGTPALKCDARVHLDALRPLDPDTESAIVLPLSRILERIHWADAALHGTGTLTADATKIPGRKSAT
jgi:hypothetical protein